MIESGADFDSLDAGTQGSTPLQVLMGISSPIARLSELTKLLLDHGASAASMSNELRMDAFTVALPNGHRGSAAIMFERGYPASLSRAGLGQMNLVRTFFGEANDDSLPQEERSDQLSEEAQGYMNCAFMVAAINGQAKSLSTCSTKGWTSTCSRPVLTLPQ